MYICAEERSQPLIFSKEYLLSDFDEPVYSRNMASVERELHVSYTHFAVRYPDSDKANSNKRQRASFTEPDLRIPSEHDGYAIDAAEPDEGRGSPQREHRGADAEVDLF